MRQKEQVGLTDIEDSRFDGIFCNQLKDSDGFGLAHLHTARQQVIRVQLQHWIMSG